jgi:hypothetical protein
MSIQKIAGTFLLGISLLTSLSAQDTRSTHWDFNDVQAGKLPSGWTIDATHPKKPLAVWEVIPKNISSPENRILALSKVQAYYGNTYNLCYTRSVPFLNGEISVQFKAVSGQIDQGGGIRVAGSCGVCRTETITMWHVSIRWKTISVSTL